MCQTLTNGQRATSLLSACDYARSLVGVPYQHQGRSDASGLDCIGLVLAAYKHIGMTFDDVPTDYGRSPRPAVILNAITQHCEQVNDLQIGDVIVMRMRHHPQHLALYVGNNEIVHSYMSSGCVVCHNLDDNYRRKIYGIYRVNL